MPYKDQCVLRAHCLGWPPARFPPRIRAGTRHFGVSTAPGSVLITAQLALNEPRRSKGEYIQ